VVNLNGTGSTNAPPALRQALINQMKKYGLGSARMNTLSMTPERVLADPNTAVVRIDGFIPAGASPGLRFDVLVTAVDSQTTSLGSGTLWTSALGINGADQAFKFMHEQATARGPIYDNPYHDGQDREVAEEFGRQQAIIVAGGTVTASRDLELVLNQSSYTRSRAIADRINERFGKTTDRKPLAKPVTDQLIKIHIPPRFAGDPAGLIDLIMHLYLRMGPGFEAQQARRLVGELERRPETEASVTLAWRSMGRPVVEVLRESYQHPLIRVRLASLEAGVWLEDERASQSLAELSDDLDPAIRERVARTLVMLPRSLTGARTLKKLLDDEDTAVRVRAYESLAAINDRMISGGRVSVADEQGTGVKYVIDTVPSEKPLVYITQLGVPRIAIFGPDLGFKGAMLSRHWDNRLMISAKQGQGYMEIFYQPSAWEDGGAGDGRREPVKLKAVPNLKTLIYLLGHKPTIEQPNEGLGLTYSQVVEVVYQMCRRGEVDAQIEVLVSPLARQISELEDSQAPDVRPETGPRVSGELEGPGDPGAGLGDPLIESPTDPGVDRPVAVRPETSSRPREAPQPPSR
jgi:Flagellar P-ring protein